MGVNHEPKTCLHFVAMKDSVEMNSISWKSLLMEHKKGLKASSLDTELFYQTHPWLTLFIKLSFYCIMFHSKEWKLSFQYTISLIYLRVGYRKYPMQCLCKKPTFFGHHGNFSCIISV